MTHGEKRAFEALRGQQRTGWGAVAAGWQRFRAEMGAPTSPVTERMLAKARLRPGDRVLDLACGVGEPAFAIAERVGPEGGVVGLDLSPEMVEAATAWARRNTFDNVKFFAIESELDLPVHPGSFDAATCRFGLMFVPDPAAALRALRDALLGGGRVVVCTWGRPERNPNFVLPMEIVGRHADLPSQGPGSPGVFALSTPQKLLSVLRSAGFAGVEAEAFETPVVEAKDAGSYWYGVGELMAPVRPALDSLTDAQRRAVREDAVRTISGVFPDGPVRMSGEVVVAAGEKVV